MLKKVLDTLDGLSEELQKFYKKGNDGKFYLQVEGGMGEGGEELATLKNAKEHEKNLRVAAEAARDAALGQVDAIKVERDTAISERDAAKAEKGADVQSIEASWSQKLEAEKAAHGNTKTSFEKEIERILIDDTAKLMATEISTVPELFADTIRRRLKVEKGADDKFFVRVLDEAGAPSATTLDDLKKEFVANDKYAAIIVAGKGSGGGADGSGSGGGAGEKSYLDHTDEELNTMQKNEPAKYQRLLDAHKAKK